MRIIIYRCQIIPEYRPRQTVVLHVSAALTSRDRPIYCTHSTLVFSTFRNRQQLQTWAQWKEDLADADSTSSATVRGCAVCPDRRRTAPNMSTLNTTVFLKGFHDSTTQFPKNWPTYVWRRILFPVGQQLNLLSNICIKVLTKNLPTVRIAPSE